MSLDRGCVQTWIFNAEVFPKTDPPIDPAAQGEEIINGKPTPVYYVLKDGCKPNLYDLEQDWGTSVDDETTLAEVFSSDDEDLDVAATLKAQAASEGLMAKSKDIRAMALAAVEAMTTGGSAPSAAKTEKDESESDGEPVNLFAAAVKGVTASSSKKPTTVTRPGLPAPSTPGPGSVSAMSSPVKEERITLQDSPPRSTGTEALALAPIPALSAGRGRPRKVVSVADGLSKMFQECFCLRIVFAYLHIYEFHRNLGS